jgi:hypothetical protein
MGKRHGLSYRCRRMQGIYSDVTEVKVDVASPVASVHSDYK